VVVGVVGDIEKEREEGVRQGGIKDRAWQDGT
jgi:hypothetical protein